MIQTYVRGYLARKQHRPRYEGISKINKIRHNAQKTVETAACLKKGREDIIEKVNDINRQIDEVINQIKKNSKITTREMMLFTPRIDLKVFLSAKLKNSNFPFRNFRSGQTC
ncbi:myosin heavy chain 95F-like [Glossina fuscipes fuscipes]